MGTPYISNYANKLLSIYVKCTPIHLSLKLLTEEIRAIYLN